MKQIGLSRVRTRPRDRVFGRALLVASGALIGILGLVSPASARTAHTDTSGYAWGTAEEVPGTGTLNAGGVTHVYSISCVSAGNCSAGGYYTDNSGAEQAFVVDETDGIWGNAEEVPGTANLNSGGNATVWSVSCASAGNCSAGGSYSDASDHGQAFVVDETNGTWGIAEELPGSVTLNAGGSAYVYSVSCRSAGYCSAGGAYQPASHQSQPFVADETNGTWGNAVEVPGIETFDGGASTAINSLSCASAGNCSAGGVYWAGSIGSVADAFVVDETNGTWGNAEEVPTPNAGDFAAIDSVSCTSAGNCSAGGSYKDDADGSQAFVVDETNGTWGNAEEVPGMATLNTGDDAIVWTLSCASAGNCSAGGSYASTSNQVQAFVVNETDGTWGNAEEVTYSGTLNAGRFPTVTAVSCSSAGNCSAGGTASNQAFVINETDGTWGSALEVPGTAALNAGNNATVAMNNVSCAPDGSCSAAGSYRDASGHDQGFVVSYGPALPTVTRLSPASGPIKGGTVVTVYGTNFSTASAVDFGSNPGTHVTVVNSDELTVASPAGSGTVDVSVVTPGGTSAVSSKDRYSYVPPPTVNGLTPASGLASGGMVVTVYGINFIKPSSVQFGSIPGTHVTIVNSGELKVTAPAGTGTVNVAVATPGGTSKVSSKDRYSYFARPIVNGIAPASGRSSGGTVVTVYGVNFDGHTVVRFGVYTGTHVTIVNSGELKVTTPAGTGTVNVTVTTPGGTSAVSSGDRFRYI